MSEPLWAPWRMEYILGPKQRGSCVFCVAQSASDVELAERLVVHAGPRALVMLNRYPFAAAHLLVIPRAHVSGLDELSLEEHDGLFRLVRASAERLARAVRCEGMNVGINLGATAGAGIAEHLHVHLVPRWSGDTNFMPVVADTRVVPQALDATRAHLAPYFADLSEGDPR
jgi:ATP adenylyltransferase